MAIGKISPSMMCAGPFEVEKYVHAFEEYGVEYLHIDIMDGSFVPNYTLGTDYVKKLRKLTKIPLDIHMMIDRPEVKLDWFDIQPDELVSVHYESTPHIQLALAKIKERGAKPILAINPGTPVESLEYLVDDLSVVLVMTVNPGFAGQKKVSQTLKKIADVRHWLNHCGKTHVEIEVDGNVSFENAKKMRAAGADIFVAGTSSILNSGMPLKDSIIKFRETIA